MKRRIRASISQHALAKWNSNIKAQTADNTLEIMDVIDADGGWWGISAQEVKARLDEIGDNRAHVIINSPGGDAFEGVAIYNLIKSHKAGADVQIISIAASAASVIAMAGDTIKIDTGAMLMLHNAWTFAVGNKHDLDKVAQTLDKVDASMREIYRQRFSGTDEELIEILDEETFLTASEAIEYGLADESEQIETVEENDGVSALRKIENALQAQGMTRSERRELLNELKAAKPSASEETDKPSAVDLTEAAALAANLNKLLGA